MRFLSVGCTQWNEQDGRTSEPGSSHASGNLPSFSKDLSRVLVIEVLSFVLVDEQRQLFLCLLVDAVPHDKVMLGHAGADTYGIPGLRANLRRLLMFMSSLAAFSVAAGSPLSTLFCCWPTFSS